jgi:hypothetical protein
MIEKDIFFILVQIEEAHTAEWPQGLIELGVPHADIEDRLGRANTFAARELAGCEASFTVAVDPWNNAFANRYRAWPDKYYVLDAARKVIAKSTYGATKDALLDVDCVDLIRAL